LIITKKPVRFSGQIFIASLYRLGNQGSERLHELLNVTQLAARGLELTVCVGFLSLYAVPHCFVLLAESSTKGNGEGQMILEPGCLGPNPCSTHSFSDIRKITSLLCASFFFFSFLQY
jgi:hypothetical protein